MTKFKLDEQEGHSKCSICKGYKALDPRNKSAIALVKYGYNLGREYQKHIN